MSVFNDKNMHQELMELGLSKNEATLYLAALNLGPCTASTLASRSKIKRPTAYLALENLIKLGLVKETFVNKRKTFVAERPGALEKLTKRMRRKVIDSEILVEKIVPSLNTMIGARLEEPTVAFYEGINGVKNVLLDVSASKYPWYLFGASGQMIKNFDPEDIAEIMEEGSKLRKLAGLPKIKLITDKAIRSLPKFGRQYPTQEIKILEQGVTASSALIISEDKLVILNFSQPFAAVIKSVEVVEVLRLMYDLIWKSLPPATKG